MTIDTPYYIKIVRNLGGYDHPDISIGRYVVARSGHDDMCECDERWKAQRVVDALNEVHNKEGR